MIPPHGATREATIQYQKTFKQSLHVDKTRDLQGLSVSALALGTYLGNYDDETDQNYAAAITSAVEKGCNFIDTAINYRCQHSERVIGQTLKKLIDKKKIRRSQIVVATKGGFIPFDGKPPGNMQEHIKSTLIDTGLVSESDVVSSCHCLHPAFLQNQINQSLKNLQVDTIDLYYLHNPETQLSVVGSDTFYKRMEKAFELLEANVDQGKIQYYGLATWMAFREAETAGESVSLEKLVQLAQKVAGKDHHLKVIQLPYNLAMLEAISIHSQSFEGKKYPILPAANYHGISVMVSAPLLQGQLVNLTGQVTQKMPGNLGLAQKCLQFVTSTPAVTSAMVGMKQLKHVDENLKVLSVANWELKTLQDVCDLVVKNR